MLSEHDSDWVRVPGSSHSAFPGEHTPWDRATCPQWGSVGLETREAHSTQRLLCALEAGQ